MAQNSSGGTVGLALQPVSDLTPGLISRITGPNKVLVTASDGKSVQQVDASTIIGGGAATPVPIVTVITSNVASLAAAPSANDGYTLLNGNVLALANQTTTANNRLYTSNGAGLLTPLATQPADGTLLSVTKGANLINSLWKYSANAVTAVGGSAGTIIGPNGTVITFGPDPAGGSNKAILNEPIDVTTLVAGTPIILYQFDCVGRNFTAGVLALTALFLQKTNSGKAAKAIAETVLLAGNPPTSHNDATQYNIDDAGGAGGYGPLVWSISGSTVRLTCTPLLSGKGIGIVSGMYGNI